MPPGHVKKITSFYADSDFFALTGIRQFESISAFVRQHDSA